MERVRRAHVLLDKAIRLAAAVELTEPELRHLLTHPDDFDGLSLGALPVVEAEDIPASATALFGQLRRLLDYAALRRDIGSSPGRADRPVRPRPAHLPGRPRPRRALRRSCSPTCTPGSRC